MAVAVEAVVAVVEAAVVAVMGGFKNQKFSILSTCKIDLNI
jgi:hypothetical protein